MLTSELRQKYLDFFKEKGHSIIPSASLIPKEDPTVLFTTAGMQQLVPYFIGKSHPMGNRLTDVQKCIRTVDIDEVGDNRHLTFFEMLGNWSLGDYFKQEAITWSFEFLTDEKWLALDPKKLFVTVFAGDKDAPKDEESIGIWQAQFQMQGISAEIGKPGKDEPTDGKEGARIYSYGKKENWWGPIGETGPCGPNSEMFYDTGRKHDPDFGKVCHPNCDCGRFVEIWNDVFLVHEKKADGSFGPLKQKNVDTGMGLERTAAMLQGKDTVFEIETFAGIFDALATLSGIKYEPETPNAKSEVQKANKSLRIIADHLRAATFIIGDENGAVPSNVGQGYIVRRLVRRAIREGRRLGIDKAFTDKVALVVIGEFGYHYKELETNKDRVISELKKEEEKFGTTLEKGLKEFEKMMKDHVIDGKEAFILFSTYGFPLELTQELVGENGGNLDIAEFKKEFEKHQELSRTASAGMFKGGLADHSEETTRLHTATHLLHKALRQVLGDDVAQKGSNITAERLRFDFTYGEKMTPEQIKEVENLVNEAIKKDLPVRFEEMSVEQAKGVGAVGLFESKYGDKVKVYFVGEDKDAFSVEICGGPHVARTSELGSFKILKEESASAGIRRIKATLS
ncbi:MAG: alanine--tRNA ligase [Patescibacteria group bacterium]|nr:alanine--tRNA ligase [Patescibacteria group bacterium]MBU2508865.1 alanine--tRNA ligase [Patescibacteria group bacterium]